MTSLLQKINDLDFRIDNINTSGGGDTTALQAQIDTNTTDISGIQTSKQNTLIAGDNITITGDTISSSAGGSGGTTIDSTTDLSCNTLDKVGDVNCGGVISIPNQISFRATRNVHAYINTNIVLPFNAITYNIGGGYNNSTYTFTAPKTGTYYFYVIFFTDGNTLYGADFLVNNGSSESILMRVERPQTGTGGTTSVPASFTTKLNSGDAVYLKRFNGTIFVAREPFTHWGGHFLG